jgi:ABC-type phosphate transport system substrate-binding protein
MLSILTRARRLAPACVLSAAAVVALAAPGAANAVERFPSCAEGTAINGEGSTLQESAMQKVWAPGYKTFCPGAGAVTYNTKGKTGSGPGMENWYELHEFGPEAQAFVGTDNPPAEAIEKKIEERETPVGSAKVLTIPTLQAAVTLIVHLPEGCTVESEPQPGVHVNRLLLPEKKIEEIFDRKVTKWSKLTNGKKTKVPYLNVFAGAECTKAKQESEITRVVRLEGSGTTATFKKWLELVNGKAEKLDCGVTWLEGGEEPPANTCWPEEGKGFVRGKGSGGIVKEVEGHVGSIGYVNLANARGGAKLIPPEGGEGKNEFWAEIENKETTKVEGLTYKLYADPATNGDEAEKADANCAENEYVTINPATGKPEKGKFPPSSTEKLWNTVTSETKQKHYPLCGFTYDLGLTSYKSVEGFGATKGEATAAGDFLEFVDGTKAGEGQTLIAEKQDYLGLPTTPKKEKNVQLIAQEGAKKVGF